MIVPPIVLVAGAIVVGLLPHLGAVVQDAAVRFQDQTAYNQAILFGRHVARPVAPARARDHRDHPRRRAERGGLGARGADRVLAFAIR